MLYIRLLGQFDVRADEQHLVLPTRASQSLLAYLVFNAGIPQRREKLAGLFWGETSDDLARRYLRNELWRIRKALVQLPSPAEEYLVSQELTIVFNIQAAFWLDVAAFEKAGGEIESLNSALALYRGELLPGFYDDWIILERERLREVYENRVSLLLDRLIKAQRWNKVSEWAERWITLGQTPEPAYRALMIAAAAQGNSAKLSLVYKRCLEALRNDLGLEPSVETRALYEQLAQETRVNVRVGSLYSLSIQTNALVTLLYADLEGSTNLFKAWGDDYATLLAELRELLRATARNWNGHEVDTQGDTFLFAFFRAAEAIAFSAKAQRALVAHAFPRDANVRVRMGIHTGEPRLTRTGYVGMDVHRAARIAAAAHGGQVLVSQRTRELVQTDLPPGVELIDLGEHKLQDLHHPLHVYQLKIAGLPTTFPPLKSGDPGP